MAHLNIFERQKEVENMIKNAYTKSDMKELAKKYNTTYNTIYMDIISLTYSETLQITRFISKSMRAKIQTRDKGVCQYCGCINKNMIIEHVIPYVKGGVAKEYNLVLSCNSCNLKKRSKVIIPNNINVLKELNVEWYNKIIKLSDRHCYTCSNWLEFKKFYNLNNKKIAEIIGTSEQNVKIMANPNKPLSTWMKAFLYSWVNEPSGADYLIHKNTPIELSIWGKKITKIPIDKNELEQEIKQTVKDKINQLKETL